MSNILTNEIKAKLTPEQIRIVEGWQKERTEREELIQQLENKTITTAEFLEKLDGTIPDRCEHDRSIMGTCSACDELERIIRPEAFQDKDE